MPKKTSAKKTAKATAEKAAKSANVKVKRVDDTSAKTVTEDGVVKVKAVDDKEEASEGKAIRLVPKYDAETGVITMVESED